MNEQLIAITPSLIASLKSLRKLPKFLAAEMYPGAPSEEIRVEAEAHINVLIDNLIAGLPQNPNKQFVMSEFMRAMENFKQPDTEERERFCGYLEEIMDITGIESSDGLLNKWLYSFSPLNS